WCMCSDIVRLLHRVRGSDHLCPAACPIGNRDQLCPAGSHKLLLLLALPALLTLDTTIYKHNMNTKPTANNDGFGRPVVSNGNADEYRSSKTKLSEDDPVFHPLIGSLPNASMSIIAARKQSQTSHQLPDLPTGKDQGYGWVVVAAVFVINFIVAGYIRSFGILLLAIEEYFPDSTNTSLGLIMALLNGSRGLTTPIMGAISVLIGARLCIFIGVILTCIGLLLAVFSTSILHIALAIGLMTGIGLSMAETPGVLVVNQYFEKLRSTANGLRVAGNPLGGMLFPLFYVPILQYFGLKGSYLMLSGVMLQMCVMGFLLRDFQLHRKYVQRIYIKKMKLLDSPYYLDHQCKKENVITEKTKKKPLEFNLLKNPVFLLFLAMNLGLSFVLPNNIYYIALYAKAIELGPWEISIVLSYYSGLDFVVRLACGWLTDLKIYTKRQAFLGGMVLTASGMFLVPLTWNMWTLMGALSLSAAGIAYHNVLEVVIMADQFGEDSVASTWGFFRMSQGIGFFATPPILGLLADVSGGLTLPFLCMGSMMILPMVFFSLQPVVGRLMGIDVVMT
ncbi:unnamed protein product, partial [Meganyctiphanes norvegica]